MCAQLNLLPQFDLCPGLRKLLQDYPAGETLIKELVQNADDAKATQGTDPTCFSNLVTPYIHARFTVCFSFQLKFVWTFVVSTGMHWKRDGRTFAVC